MKKQILFIHSAGPQENGQGSSKLVSNLEKSLENEYEIHFPMMPSPDHPYYALWKEELARQLNKVGPGVILIGHSLGGSILLKYLSEESVDKQIAALYLIATPFWGKEDWEVEEYMLEENFGEHLPLISKIILYHSHDDDTVPFHHMQEYYTEIPNALMRPVNGLGHEFKDGLPALVEDIQNLNMS